MPSSFEVRVIFAMHCPRGGYLPSAAPRKFNTLDTAVKTLNAHSFSSFDSVSSEEYRKRVNMVDCMR